MPNFGPVLPSLPPDLDEELIQYRWDPIYTMGQASIKPFSRPTGGEFVFRMIPPMTVARKVHGRDFRDMLSLTELTEVLTDKKGSKAAEMYRGLITDSDNVIDPKKVATNLRVFGVTSISQCLEWHRDCMSPAQPILIFGACHVDKTDYKKQDTLRIPVKYCEIDPTDRTQDPIRYVHMTLGLDTVLGWRLKFIITPYRTYINEEMMMSEGYSLTYPVGFVDFINMGADNTSIYMYKSSETNEEEPNWYVEGFVFDPTAVWNLTYRARPLEFYSSMNSFHDIWGTMAHDRNRRSIVDFIMRKVDEEKDNDNDTQPPLKRMRPTVSTNTVELNRKMNRSAPARQRFYGHGRLGKTLSRYNPTTVDTTIDDDDSGGHPAPQLPKYTPIKPTRSVNDTVLPKNTEVRFYLTNKAPRSIGTHMYRTLFSDLSQTYGHGMYDRLNGYLDTAMKSKGVIVSNLIKHNGDAVSVSAKDIFLVLAMAFVGRIRVHAVDKQTASRVYKNIRMDRLFTSGDGQEKLKCLINYFGLAMQNSTNHMLDNNRIVTFIIKDKQNGSASNPIKRPLALLSKGPGIEAIPNTMHADFANKFFGGGVLDNGSVQEEILLITHPEALFGKAIFPVISNTEALEILGAIKVSEYTGYGRGVLGRNAFAYARPVANLNLAPLDKENRALTGIVAFDAINYTRSKTLQYHNGQVIRAFHKAYAAFCATPGTDPNVPVTTGRWGGGAFSGDSALAALVQIAAASYVGRPLIFTKMPFYLVVGINKIMDLVIAAKMTVDGLMDVLRNNLKRPWVSQKAEENEKLTIDKIITILSTNEDESTETEEEVQQAVTAFQDEVESTLTSLQEKENGDPMDEPIFESLYLQLPIVSEDEEEGGAVKKTRKPPKRKKTEQQPKDDSNASAL